MSYDPYSSPTDEPRPGEPYDDRIQSYDDRIQSVPGVKDRVQAPAIGLIVVGVLNLFFALYMAFNSIVTTVLPAEKLKAQQTEMYKMLPPAMQENIGQKTAEEVKMQAMLINWPLALFTLLASVLPLAGGVRMLSLKSYGLGVCGAICAAVPCISITACCGLGEIIGIWALVVLLNPDVKSAFR